MTILQRTTVRLTQADQAANHYPTLMDIFLFHASRKCARPRAILHDDLVNLLYLVILYGRFVHGQFKPVEFRGIIASRNHDPSVHIEVVQTPIKRGDRD